MKAAIASIAGIAVVGSLALFVYTPPSVPEPVRRDLASAPREAPEPEPAREATAREAPAAPVEVPRRDETIPPAPVPEAAAVGGTIRDEDGAPIALADVYLAVNPPPGEGFFAELSLYMRADFFERSRFFETKTDSEGRYLFEGVRAFGDATLGAFKAGYAGPKGAGSTAKKRVKVEAGTSRTDVDLIMAAGKTLAGRVLLADGSPVSDAVVSVPTAWSPKNHIFWPAGLAPTDADGRFRLGFDARAAGCHLRVSSESHGQEFFIEVPVRDGTGETSETGAEVEAEEVELTFKELAHVEGTITWTDGTPASGLTVRVNGRLPEPPIPVSRMGMRSFVVHDALVGDKGTYVIEGLHPGLTYDIFIIDGSLGEEDARKEPLTPRLRNSFRLDAGGVKVWDYALPSAIAIRGHIRTEKTATPLPEAQVGVIKDGKRLKLISVWADAEGFFELRLNMGPGEYRVHAEPPVGSPPSEAVSDLIDARFGRTLQLSGGMEVEVDLTIFEPADFPIRVLDHAGEPVKNVTTKLHVDFPNGQRLRHETTRVLDESGRTAFRLYFPAPELWYEIGASRGGPTTETARHAIDPGTVLPEETVILPRTCDLVAAVLNPAGKAYAEEILYLRVVYEDGSQQNLAFRTDPQGRLEEKGCVRAAAFVLEVRAASSKAKWTSPQLDASAAEVLDLGEIVLGGEGG